MEDFRGKMFYKIKYPISKYILKIYPFKNEEKYTRSAIKSQRKRSWKWQGVDQMTKTTQAQDWGEMVREDMASGYICIYSLPLSIKDEW